MNYQIFVGYFVYLTSVQYSSVLVLLGVYILCLYQLGLKDFGRIHWQNGGVKND